MAKLETKKQESDTTKESLDEVLENKKADQAAAGKAVKKAGPKAERAKKETTESEKPEKAEEKVKKAPIKPARPRHERQGKKFREAYNKVEQGKDYDLEEGVKLAQATSYAKFDASVEMHINLGVDPKQADQMVRGTVVLPHGSGKSQRVAVVAGGDEAKAAKEAGADTVGEKDLLEDIGKGKFDFDVLIATPSVMKELGKYAKELGPKGLMPNPKSGTVTEDVAKAVKELKGGRVEFRVDDSAIIHSVIGKVSFKPEMLLENAKTLLKAINAARPANTKGTYMQRITVTTSMGPGIRIAPASFKE